MRFIKHPSEGDGAFQLAPLIDIVFIVLVFFIVASTLREAERAMGITPPVAENTVEPVRKPFQIVVNIARDGTIVVNKDVWEMPRLVERLKALKDYAAAGKDANFSVIIRADGQTVHQNVMNVMDACIAAGVEQVWFVTVDKEPASR